MRKYFQFVLYLANLLEVSSLHVPTPRMTFTDRDITIQSIPLPQAQTHVHVQLVEDGKHCIIMTAGREIYSIDFQNRQLYRKTPLLKSGSGDSNPTSPGSHFNITLLHKRNRNKQVFLCGTSLTETACCYMNTSSAECTASRDITNTISMYILKEGQPSFLIGSSGDEELYVTQPRTEKAPGIYKFGKNRVRPTTPNNALPSVEQQYLSLVPIRSSDKPLQDKLYAFFNEKKQTVGCLESDIWVPFVSQTCMADKGGTNKNKLQFQWTTQLKARLFCGDKTKGQHYSELVDVASLHAEDGKGTRVYALFRNEWGMSAVCVYSIHDIKNIFESSTFKGHTGNIPNPRPGTCTDDVKNIDVLEIVENHPEMEDVVQPIDFSAPLLVSRHHYTHIRLDAVQTGGNDNHTVLFLSQENGKIHKVLDNKTQAFFIAEYSVFTHKANILDMMLHSSERKLYVSSNTEVVQVDVQRCGLYGARCEDCVLARDPYCGWNTTHCVPATSLTVQDVERGNHAVCQSVSSVGLHKITKGPKQREFPTDAITVSLHSSYFLQCPVSSRHAAYTWLHNGNQTACIPREHQCLFLIHSMGHDEEGAYRCVSEELGFSRTLARYHLQMNSTSLLAPPSLVWICMMALVISLFQ